ncbi:Rtf2 RING-finger-domain-containing protein [Suillus paluster]|uniref:Rtf2 RING-finger-domain-containing protein n=1 Tax=Suillus paluster TaxID=48578 RepID=UPI001B86F9B9|nr:Rtf2 RING-finger-domain-containing protein [Suillus paluster]KAG1741861.1 Rtf2 RING-finger-domain-containing protein [Suillus paluster]
MGNDGGSIPDRRDLVKNKPKAEQADKANQTRARWFFCALSKRPLQEPIVSCALGKLYNKDAIIEHLLDKTVYGDAGKICGHIRSLKDIKVLKLTLRSPPPPPDSSADVAKFVCPLTFKEMNGGQPFVYILTCGCVFSQSGLRTVLGPSPPNGNAAAEESPADKDDQLEVCPQCATKFSRSSDIFMINPPLEEEERMYVAMELRRSREPAKKSKKRKAGADAVADEVATKKKKGSLEDHSPSPAPGLNPKISAASRSLAQSLAAEEAKRKAGMSDAVKSLYRGKNDAPRKETFMTMGTFTRYA